MTDFTEKMRLKGKAEEDLYFAALDKKLIQALREKHADKTAEVASEQSHKNSHKKEDK